MRQKKLVVIKSHSLCLFGSGLGLSIVKNILDIHKADYGVESEYTKGACFWFELDRVNKPKKEIAKIVKSERINNKQDNK